MLAHLAEDVTLVRKVGGTVDPLTKEVIGATETTQTIRVTWATAPTKQPVFDAVAGRVTGIVQTADASMLYEPRGRPTDIDWTEEALQTLVIRRGTEEYVPVSVGEGPRRGRQVVKLRKVETGRV